MKRPVIGIAGNILVMEGGMFPGLERDYVNRDYVQSVYAAGGAPVIMAVMDDEDMIRAQVERVDGIILSGGYDIVPQLYGQEPMWEQGFAFPLVDNFYLKIIKIAKEIGKPVFGICKGIQALNVAFGGTLYQDLKRQVPESLKHNQAAPRQCGTHEVSIAEGSFLSECLPEKIMVNSYHHQSVNKVADGFRITAQSSDGVIEGIENTEGSLLAAVQWHPEMMASHGNLHMLEVFKKFIEKTRQ